MTISDEQMRAALALAPCSFGIARRAHTLASP